MNALDGFVRLAGYRPVALDDATGRRASIGFAADLDASLTTTPEALVKCPSFSLCVVLLADHRKPCAVILFLPSDKATGLIVFALVLQSSESRFVAGFARSLCFRYLVTDTRIGRAAHLPLPFWPPLSHSWKGVANAKCVQNANHLGFNVFRIWLILHGVMATFANFGIPFPGSRYWKICYQRKAAVSKMTQRLYARPDWS